MTATGTEALELLRETERVLVAAVDAGNIIGFAEKPLAAVYAAHVRSGRGLTADQARQAVALAEKVDGVVSVKNDMRVKPTEATSGSESTSGTTDGAGVFDLGRLSSTVAQTKTITATVNGSVIITQQPAVTVNPDVATGANTTIAAMRPSEGVDLTTAGLLLLARARAQAGPVGAVEQVDERVGQPRVAAVLLDDEQRSRLLPTAVAAGRLGRVEAVEEPLGQRRAGRPLERLGERVNGVAGDEDVALGRVARSGAAARPGLAFLSGERRRPPLRIHDPDLPALASLIIGEQQLQGLFGALPAREQLQALGPERRVPERLRRERTDPGFRPGHHGADREELRLHAHPRLAGLGVEADGRMFCCAHCAKEVGVTHVRA